MTCWPPCSAWCECVDDVCQPSPVRPNAVRIRTGNGRYLRAINGPTQYMRYLGPTSNVPGPWDTFMLDQPGNWPLRSGDRLAMHAVDNAWAPLAGPSLIRIDQGVCNLGMQVGDGAVSARIRNFDDDMPFEITWTQGEFPPPPQSREIT